MINKSIKKMLMVLKTIKNVDFLIKVHKNDVFDDFWSKNRKINNC